jgi:hypothetical protein
VVDLGAFHDPAHLRTTWQQVVAAAERHYEPGRFTTFVGFEWTLHPNFVNLHRNVVFRGTDVPELPFSSIESRRPEDLWNYMETARAAGSDVLAIPHNANKSDGLMFQTVDSDGNPIDAAYAAIRMANEPLVEAFQINSRSRGSPRSTQHFHPTTSSPTSRFVKGSSAPRGGFQSLPGATPARP